MYSGHNYSPVWSEDRLLERCIWSSFRLHFRWNLDFPLRAPLSRWWRRVLRTIYHHRSFSQRPEDNLYEYCVLAQEICGFGVTFVASYGSEGVFFGRRQSFRMWPLHEPPWTRLGSFWIIFVMFEISQIFDIFGLIFSTFCHRAGSCWNKWG